MNAQKVESKYGCIKCLDSYKRDHKCKPFFLKYMFREHKVNFAICRCKQKKPENSSNPCGVVVDGDIIVEASTTNNSLTINSSLVGAIGFDVEILEFLDKDEKPVKVLVAYDSYCPWDCFYNLLEISQLSVLLEI